MMKKTGIGIPIACAVAGVAFVGGMVLFHTFYQEEEKQASLVYENTSDVVTGEIDTLNQEELESDLQGMGNVCLDDYNFTHSESYEGSDYFGDSDVAIPGTNSQYVYSYDGSIQAGVDCGDIDVEKNEDDETITVTIPDAQIFNAEIDPDSREILYEKDGIFGGPDVDEVTAPNDSMIEYETDQAIQGGLLDRAKQNAKETILNYIEKNYDLGDYQVCFRETGSAAA